MTKSERVLELLSTEQGARRVFEAFLRAHGLLREGESS